MNIARIKAKISTKSPTFLIRDAYKNQSFTDYIFQKCIRYYNEINDMNQLRYSDYRIFIPFAFLNSKELNILDFGGGGGNTFTIAQKYFGPKIKSWTVVETSQMAASASISYDPRLYFTDEMKELKTASYDLIICSSSLQYCDDPEETLRSIAMLKADYVWITRTTIVSNRTVGAKQVSRVHKNGPQLEGENLSSYERNYEVEYLMTPVEDSLLDSLLSDSYTEVFRAEEEPDMFSLNGTKVSQWGILLKLNEKIK